MKNVKQTNNIARTHAFPGRKNAPPAWRRARTYTMTLVRKQNPPAPQTKKCRATYKVLGWLVDTEAHTVTLPPQERLKLRSLSEGPQRLQQWSQRNITTHQSQRNSNYSQQQSQRITAAPKSTSLYRTLNLFRGLYRTLNLSR